MFDNQLSTLCNEFRAKEKKYLVVCTSKLLLYLNIFVAMIAIPNLGICDAQPYPLFQ